MNYFQPYSLPADQTILAAWDSQLAELSEFPELVNALAKQRELFSRFAAHYAKLRALPRGTRRALQRKLARARDLITIQPEWQRKLAGSLAGAALLLALVQSAGAATITVTTNVPDINDGDGKCSLIEAIVNANNDAATHPDCQAGDGADTIVLPKGSTITLTNSYSPLSIVFGTPAITGAVTIQGNGTHIVNGGFPRHIIFVRPSGDVTLQNLTLENGRIGATNYGKLRIENSTIAGNGFTSATYINGSPHRGRGISNLGTITISNSVITGNHTFGVEKSGGMGAGMLNGGVAYVSESTFFGNTVAGSGGGIFNGGTLMLQNSTVAGNTAIDSQHRLSNFAKAFGGGIFNGRSSYLKIENSTVSGNMVQALAGFRGSRSYGGGIANTGRLVIASSTISGNTATADSSSGDSFGGGVENSGDLTLTQTIISGNTAESGPEVYTTGAVAADVFNLFGSQSDAGVTGFTPGMSDIVPKSPLKKILGPLKDNGGPTDTHSLLKGSPAINAAPADGNCPETDQRGVTRPKGGGCDIGAVEYTGKSSKKNKQ